MAKTQVTVGLVCAALACASAETDDGSDVVRFGFGREPSAAEIAALDIDVMPDGTGLPAGSGTVRRGMALYKAQCASCHGATGREGPYGRLVGRVPNDEFPFGKDRTVRSTIGNYWPYATTLYDYVLRTMPFGNPGTLEADEVYSLVAALLYMNDIIAEDALMNAETLPAVVMPARDRFVVDDRKGGLEVR